jgi:hypothetical protein
LASRDLVRIFDCPPPNFRYTQDQHNFLKDCGRLFQPRTRVMSELNQHVPGSGPEYPAPGSVIPPEQNSGMAGYVVGECGHRLPAPLAGVMEQGNQADPGESPQYGVRVQVSLDINMTAEQVRAYAADHGLPHPHRVKDVVSEVRGYVLSCVRDSAAFGADGAGGRKADVSIRR